MAISPDGAWRIAFEHAAQRIVVIGDDGSRRQLPGQPNPPYAFDPSSKTLAYADAESDRVRLYSTANGSSRTIPSSMELSSDNRLGFSEDSRLLWVQSRLLHLVSTETLRVVADVIPVGDGAVVRAANGWVALVGVEWSFAPLLGCRFGNRVYPFELCADRFVGLGIAGRALAGEEPRDLEVLLHPG